MGEDVGCRGNAIAEAVFERIDVLGMTDYTFTLTGHAKARDWDAGLPEPASSPSKKVVLVGAGGVERTLYRVNVRIVPRRLARRLLRR